MILTSIEEAAARYPQKIAIQMEIGGHYERHTYEELLVRIAGTASALAALGIEPGDRVILLAENRPEWIVAYLSVVSLGVVIVPLDAQITVKEAELLLANSGAKAAFVSLATKKLIPLDSTVKVIFFDPDEGLFFPELLLAHPDAKLPATPSGDAPAALLYTSGTTGDPKGVMLSHGNLASNAASLTELDILGPSDNMLCLLPLHHTYPALACMLLPLGTGTTITILNSLKGPDITACMQETGVSIMLGVPQLFSGLRRAIFDEIDKKPSPLRSTIKALLTLNAFLRKTVNINLGKSIFGKVHERFGTALRIFVSGGARLDPDIYTDMFNLGFTVIEGYGLTETSPVCTFNPLTKPKAGSIGIPIPGVEIKIVNPDKNGQGEIAVRGPNIMLGYYNKPQETAEILKEGWFYTGDLGYRDQDGYFFITGRSKEIIVLPNGKNIFPEELEKYYMQAPAIKELCLLQTRRGLEAAVVPDFDYLRKMRLANSRDVINFALADLARNLPPYKRINGFKVISESLPVTRLGKLKRKLVASLYRESEEQTEKQPTEPDLSLLTTPVAQKFLACLAPFSAQKEIAPDDNLEIDLGLDSLARVELIVSLEKSFGISLPDTFGSELFTVRDAVLRLDALLSSGQVTSAGQVRMSWGDILRQKPDEEMEAKLAFDAGLPAMAFRYLLKGLLKLTFFAYNRLSVQGLDNLPDDGPFVLAPNHLSLIDGPVIVAALPWRVASRTFSLGTTDYFGGPFMSGIAKLIQVIPVDMEARLQGALQLSAQVLRKGNILCVFPEGGRSRDGKIKEFKKGVGIIARELNIPLVPVAIKGAYEAFAIGYNFPRPAKITVTIGKPFLPDNLDYEGIAKKLQQEVAKLQ